MNSPTVTYSNPVSIESSATTTGVKASFNIAYLVILSNDGTDNISFTFGNGATYTLKPGDKITDLPFQNASLSFLANSGSQPFRAWGLI